MANQDLQTLYQLRDALKREEYIKTFNNGIDENLKKAANTAVTTYVTKKNAAYTKYARLKNEKVQGSINSAMRAALLFVLIPAAITAILIFILSSDVTKSLLHLSCTVTWALMVSWFASLGTDKQNQNRGRVIKTMFAVFALFFVITAIIASMYGVSGFWRWLLAILVYAVWPIANFFFLKPVVWLSLVSLFFILCAGIAPLYENFFARTENDKKDDLRNAEQSSDVRQAKGEYDIACRAYETAYNREYERLAPSFQKLKKADNYTQEKRALLPVVPANLQNLDMVNKLIWCIEQRYADTIVQARNWYLQQAQNMAMMQKLDGVAATLNDMKKIQQRAADEAAAAHRATLAALQEQTDAINKQTGAINKQLGKLNTTAKENAEANKQTAAAADKIHRELKY